MASLDHIILKVNDLNASVSFYTEIMGFALDGDTARFEKDGPPGYNSHQ